MDALKLQRRALGIVGKLGRIDEAQRALAQVVVRQVEAQATVDGPLASNLL